MKFIVPEIPHSSCKVGLPAVYKMTINETFVYIGSSKNVLRRINKWVGKIKRNDSLTSKIKPLVGYIEIVRFDILEIIHPDKPINYRLSREAKFLKLHKNNPFLLNIVPVRFFKSHRQAS